jgi:NAD(P)-dependent dehydrogenase (short-subunit alcohol dehydrogenase family)
MATLGAMDLEGRVALVTGAGSGIGHAARLPRAFAHEANVADPDDVARMVDATVERFGSLDVPVNNAAINHEAPLLEVGVDDWDAVLEVNLRGPFCCLQAA